MSEHPNDRHDTFNAHFRDDYEVSVIYFRAGYEPGHYPTENEWSARLLMERWFYFNSFEIELIFFGNCRSKAIKCPSIQYHLAGTKKVQQALAKGGAVERFLGDAQHIETVKDIFTGLYSLDFDEFGEQAVQMALNSPERYLSCL